MRRFLASPSHRALNKLEIRLESPMTPRSGANDAAKPLVLDEGASNFLESSAFPAVKVGPQTARIAPSLPHPNQRSI